MALLPLKDILHLYVFLKGIVSIQGSYFDVVDSSEGEYVSIKLKIQKFGSIQAKRRLPSGQRR